MYVMSNIFVKTDTKFTHIWSNIEILIISNIIKQLNAPLINKGKIN